MVIVSSTKALSKTKKKSLSGAGGGVATSRKAGGESKHVAVARSTTKFPRPSPRPLPVVATTTLVGGGRGKVKTTRNNTLPLPSPKSGLLANGPRIHAQRKFAQGATTTFGSSGLSSVHANYSPAATPTKDGHKFRKRVLTPISPPLKRPKTEDFLTFLCFRGTPALPSELDYFNYTQPVHVDEIQVQTKKPKESVSVSVSTGVGCTSTDDLQNSTSIEIETESICNGPSKSSTDIIDIKISNSNEPSTSKSNGKHLVKSLPSNKTKSALATATKKQSTGTVSSSKEKSPDESSSSSNNKKDNGVPIQKKSVPVPGKLVAKKTAAVPQISPSTSRINEQDAKFAMTALKLKYQEKRLASVRPAKSLITLLTKKVKERSMVLTRSKAKTAVGPLKTSPLQRKRPQKIVRPPVKPLPRNAPSPDIILGISQSPVKLPDTRRSSSSESESSSESKKSSSESSSSSSESEDEEPVHATRSLRNGKEVVTKSKTGHQQKSSSSSSKKSSSPSRRPGTRSSHRQTKSPLRELPMWNVKKKKILAKYKKNSAKAKANLSKNSSNGNGSSLSKSGSQHVTRSSLRKSSGFNKDKGRPSRKTKETAAIYMGLMNKGFSSDDDESNGESDGEDRASSVGDSSASETKYLENHYQSSLKRTKDERSSSKKDEKESSSSSKSRSKKQRKSSKRDSSKSRKTSSDSEKPQHKTSKSKEEKPLPRVLRSRSSGSVDSNSRMEAASAAERRRILLMTCGKNTAGAARKSATVVSRGRRSRNYSSSEDDAASEKSDDRGSSSDDMEDEDEENDLKTESQTEEELEEEKHSGKRDYTPSPMSIPSSRGSKAKVRRVAELINESKGSSPSPSSRRSMSSSPSGRRSRSASADNKSITSESLRGSNNELHFHTDEQSMDVDDEDDEEEEVEDPIEDDEESQDVPEAEKSETEEEIEEEDPDALRVEHDDEDEEADDELVDDSVVASPLESDQESFKNEESTEEIENEIVSPVPSNSTSPTGSSASEVESDAEDEDDDEEDVPEPVPKVDIAIQVDMDLEEEEEKAKEKRRLEEEQRLLEEKRREEQLREEKEKEERLKEERHREEKRREERREERRREEKLRKEEEKRRKIEACSKGTSARTAGIELPLSEQQRAELRQAQEEDDEIQEIGQVINNPAAINHANHARRASPSPPIVPEPPRIHHHPPPQPEPVPMSIPLPMPPLSTRTSSLTYTSHHINLGGSAVPFVPYSTRPPTSDFFPPPPIHFGHTHLVNSVHLVGSSATGHGVGVDFTSELTSPLNALSIPVSVPTLPSFPNPLLPPGPPICLGPGVAGATMTATSLQTHIRTVATNLDIPLVRPVVGATETALSFSHLGLGAQGQLGTMPLIGAAPTTSLLSRPMGPWGQPTTPAAQAGAAAAAAAVAAATEARNHYSAFRLPNLGQPPSVSTNGPTQDIFRTSVASSLPVSIVPPRSMAQQMHGRPLHHHHHQPSTSLAQGIQQRDFHSHHHHSSSSSSSAYMQGYNPESIIRNLPNVSIVPKFDRSSAKTQLPSQKPVQSSSSNSSSSSSKKHSSGKNEEPKKPGKKKSKPTTLPTPSSPLTVRKDSNPATYVGASSKLKKKSESSRDPSEKPSSAPASSSSSSSSCVQQRPTENASPKITKFEKMINVKQERIDVSEMPHSCSSASNSSCKDSQKGKSSPGPPLLRLDQIKQEVIMPSTSSSGRKSQSPLLTHSQHRKTPDRPCSSSSAHSHSEKASEDSRKSSSKKSSSSKKLLEAPTYHPTEQEFEDPLKYFEKIQPEAEKYGMARIVPPRSFRPECNVNDDMRFTAYNHYIHRMFRRWGPTVQETEAIKEHLKRSDVDVSSVPVIGGLEIDFSTLYQAVQSFGGLKEVMQKEKWVDVADRLHIPKGTHDRATKLDSVYVKYILPYDLLSEEERKNLLNQVDDKWVKRQQKLQERTEESSEDETSDEDSMDELDDCVIKGKGTPLSSYYRVARNTVGMIFSNGKEPSIQELEDEYWKIVREGKKHLCVYSGSIDCAGVGWGFPAPKPSAKHPWNLKVLANNTGSVLRSMGPVMGATVPTLHVSMLFTTYCWYRDPHGLPWVEYLHSGASKIWYSVAAAHEHTLRKALLKLMPLQCKNKKLWLPSDSAMVPPELLLENDVPLVRTVQNPGEFLVVFPKSYTSAVCGGYLVSESVCFAPPVWLKSCMELFKDIRDSKEPPVFPIEKLLLSIVRDNKVTSSVMKLAAPLVEKVIHDELANRKKLISMGVSQGGKPNKNGSGKGVAKKKKSATAEEEVEQCYFCNYILHMSLVRNEKSDFVTCLPHAIQHLSRHKAQIKKCSLLCEETQDELESLLQVSKRRANS